MVSLYVKGKENGHVQAYAPTGAMVLKWRSSLTSKLDGYPVTSEPHLWRQACPWRKSLSRKIALTRIKFYGRNLPWIHSKISAVPVFALFFLLGAMVTMQAWRPPSAVVEGFLTPCVRLCIFCANCHGLSRQLSRTIVPTATDYRANCHRSSGRIGHLFNLHFGSRWLTEPFR